VSYRKILIISAVIAIPSLLFAVGLGAVSYSPMAILRVILSKLPFNFAEPPLLEINMIWKLRLPRILLGFVVGGSLALCGVCMQALVKNKLADPFVLGVSSGASAAASLFMVFGVFSFFGRYSLAFSAFLGALISIAAVYTIGRVNGRIHVTQLLLGGVAIAMIMDAVTSYVGVAAPNAFSMYNVSFWLSGSLAGARWEYLGLPLIIMLLCGGFLLLHYRKLDALTMGEETAVTLGVDTNRMQKALILISSLLAGAAISVSGSIGFVGMIIPHLCRSLVGANHKRLLPLSVLFGGVLVVWADVAARLVAAPEEIPVGILTALVGAPFFLVILKNKNIGGS
jgi:ABC-type Fe3+-siderophore transport system, permease component